MMIMKKLNFIVFFYIFLATILLSCSSSPEKVKYYSLSLNNNYPNSIVDNQTLKNKHHVVVGPVHLAEFLQQEGIIMQIGEYQINVASYHNWAEPLDKAIEKTLVMSLNEKTDYYQFERNTGLNNKKTEFNFSLEFDQFHATDNATIIVSGQYWFYQKNNKLILNKTFNFSDKLTKNGYLHSIKKLRQAIDKLAMNIINSLPASNMNNQ